MGVDPRDVKAADRRRVVYGFIYRIPDDEMRERIAQGRVTLEDVELLIDLLDCHPTYQWLTAFLYAEEMAEAKRKQAEADEERAGRKLLANMLARAVPADEKSAEKLDKLKRILAGEDIKL